MAKKIMSLVLGVGEVPRLLPRAPAHPGDGVFETSEEVEQRDEVWIGRSNTDEMVKAEVDFYQPVEMMLGDRALHVLERFFLVSRSSPRQFERRDPYRSHQPRAELRLPSRFRTSSPISKPFGLSVAATKAPRPSRLDKVCRP
jgi:hypothetical protein